MSVSTTVQWLVDDLLLLLNTPAGAKLDFVKHVNTQQAAAIVAAAVGSLVPQPTDSKKALTLTKQSIVPDDGLQ